MELNKVMLVGNLTRDPDYRETPSGRAVAKLGLAVNRRFGGNRETGERNEETLFIDVDVWERQAEFCRNYLRKGSRIFVEGRLRMDQWQDQQSGTARSKIYVVAERVQFGETRAESQQRGEGGYAPQGGEGGFQSAPAPSAGPQMGGGQRPMPSAPPDTADDLPF